MPAVRAKPPPAPPGTWAAGVAAATGVTLDMARWGRAVLCYAPVAAPELLTHPVKGALIHGGAGRCLAAEGCGGGRGAADVQAGLDSGGPEHSSGATAAAPAGAQAAAAPATKGNSGPAHNGGPGLRPGIPCLASAGRESDCHMEPTSGPAAGPVALPSSVSAATSTSACAPALAGAGDAQEAVVSAPVTPREASTPAHSGDSSACAAAARRAHQVPGGGEQRGFGHEQALVPPCAICDEALAGRDVALFPCGHFFCDVCARQHLALQHACPTCRAKAKPAHVFRCRHRRQTAAPRGEDPALAHVRPAQGTPLKPMDLGLLHLVCISN